MGENFLVDNAVIWCYNWVKFGRKGVNFMLNMRQNMFDFYSGSLAPFVPIQ